MPYKWLWVAVAKHERCVQFGMTGGSCTIYVERCTTLDTTEEADGGKRKPGSKKRPPKIGKESNEKGKQKPTT